jgi:hypothetical protein
MSISSSKNMPPGRVHVMKRKISGFSESFWKKSRLGLSTGIMLLVPSMAMASTSAPAELPEPGTIFYIISSLLGLAALAKKLKG